MPNMDDRSSFWRDSATAALAGGVGYGLYRTLPDARLVFRAGARDIAQETARELQTLGRFHTQRLSTPVAGSVNENILRNLTESVGAFSSSVQGGKHVRADIAQAAYEAILAGGRTTHPDAYREYQKVLNQTSVRSAYETAKQAVASSSGDANVLVNRISSLGEGGFYIESRLHELAKAGVSPGAFMGSAVLREPVRIQNLVGEIGTKAQSIQARLSAVAGQAIKWEGVYNIPDILEGKAIETPILRGVIGGQALNIPLAGTGVTYGGKNLTARYMTRGAYGPSGPIADYTEQYVAELEEAMSRQKTKTGLKNAVIDANHKVIQAMNDRDSASRAMAIWKMPEAMLSAGGRVKARMNMMEAVYTGGRMTESLQERIVKEAVAGGRQLYPIGSPGTVAKGTFVTSNLATELYGPLGRLMGVEKRPTQFIREEFGVSALAKARAPAFKGKFGEFYGRLERKIKGPGYESLIYGGAPPTSVEAYTAPQLATFYVKPQELETGQIGRKMFAEEAVISRGAAPMLEYERTVQRKISLEKNFRVNQQILEALKGKKVGELATLPGVARGGFVGIATATGKELWAEGPGGADVRVVGAQLTGENTANVFLKETHKLSDDKWWKFFSEDVKFMGRAASEKRVQELLSDVGMQPFAGSQDIEAIVSGKLVSKNKAALMNQQIEAMSMIMSTKMGGTALRKTGALSAARQQVAEEFMNDPARYLKLDRLMQENIADAEFQIQKNMVSLTRKFGFKEQEMGLVFGLMDTGTAARLGIADEVAQARGVIGLSKMRLGDFAFEGGAGGLASFEQSGMGLLAMKGEEGKRFAAEIATRLRDKGELLPANRMMASVLNQRDLKDQIMQLAGKGKVDEKILGSLAADELLQESGRYVKFGRGIKAFGGAKQIYIPGLAEAESLMAPTISDKGLRIPSGVAGGLEELRQLLSSSATQEEVEESALRLREQIVRQTESQAAAKGKVLGSRFLTGIRQTAIETSANLGAVTISPRAGERMFDELISRAKDEDQKTFLYEQKRKLIDDGHELVGGMWRHPTTGPESFQFVRYKVDRNLADEMIGAPYQMGELVLGSKRKAVDISPMVGMKGDFDKDMFAIAAISDRDTANRVANKMGGEVQQGYTSYLFNHYAMKDLIEQRKSTVNNLLDLSYEEALQQGARQLTTAKIATPQVNVALRKLKLGLQYSAPEQYRPLAELFWHLEEAAIGSKHGVQESAIYQDIARAVNQRDVSTMEGVIKRLMGEKDVELSGQITGPTGELQTKTMKYTPRLWAQQAIESTAVVGADVEAAYRSVQSAKGVVSQDLPQLVEMYYKRRTGSLDVAQSVMQSKEYGMPGFTEQTNRVLRKAQSKSRMLFGALRKARAPVLAGAAIAAGAMMSAPSISGAIQPHASGRNLQPDDLGPPSGQGMTVPPGRIMKSPSVYDLTGTKLSSRAKIRMSMNDLEESSGDFMKQASVLANGGNVRVHTVDDRSALSPHRLANKIYERL